ncbi:MAG: signal peptidase II [Clostridia bacterium]|nr:signal peptidase II [Clostridia bacterium]
MTFKEKAKKFFSKTWEYIKVAKVELIVLAALLAADLITKAVIAATMHVGQSITLIPKFLSFTYTHNKNAAFGSAFGLDKILGEVGVRVVLLIITALAVAFFSVFLYRIRGKHITGRIGLALLISGALGNFVDRLIFGYVRDFVEIIFFGLDLPLIGESFAIFNIADIGVTVGVILFLVYILFFSDWGKEKKSEEKSEYVLLEEENAAEEAKEQTSDSGSETVGSTVQADASAGTEGE